MDLRVAVEYIKGGAGAPAAAVLDRGVATAYQKADQLLAAGPDRYGLTRDEIAAVNLYTQDNWLAAGGGMSWKFCCSIFL